MPYLIVSCVRAFFLPWGFCGSWGSDSKTAGADAGLCKQLTVDYKKAAHLYTHV